MALEQHTSSGLSMTNALFRVADRMGSTQQRQLLEPHAARELSLLQSDMRHCANGLMEALLRIRHLYRQVLLSSRLLWSRQSTPPKWWKRYFLGQL